VSAPALVRPDRARAGLLFHPKVEASRELAVRLAEALAERGGSAELVSSWDEAEVAGRLEGLDWVVALGGDGTVLRTARLAARHGVPVIGVNFGRLGYLAEIPPAEALARLPDVLDGAGTLEERLMLRSTARSGGSQGNGARILGPLDAVNEVFVGRGRVARAVRLETSVDRVPLIRLTADGLIVATSTGSTAYSLSAGGPVVSPEVDVILLTPVAPHPTPVRTIILPGSAVVDITVHTDQEAIYAVDGQTHHDLADGDTVRVQAAPYRFRLLRLGPAEAYYRALVGRLGGW